MITKEQVLEALSHVDDPDLHKDLVTLNMIRDVEIDNYTISFSVFLTTPACPMKDMIENACRNAISHFIGSEYTVNIKMTSELTNDKKTSQMLPFVKNIIAVASGKGGVGKSTISASLAKVYSQLGIKVGLLDADIYGPSIPTMFGLKEAVIDMIEIDGKELMQPITIENLKLFSIGFLSKPNEAIVWRGPMISQALKQFITGVNWGELDYLIIDLPPGTGDIQITLTQTMPISGAVIVTTPQQMSIADASRACAMFRMPNVNVPIMGIIENMSYFTPEDAPDKKYHIFGEGGGKQLADLYQTELLGQLPISPKLMQDIDTGNTLKSENLNNFTEIAQQLARQIVLQNMKIN